jgi:uncharacterized membrane protein
MRLSIVKLRDGLMDSFWFIPALMAVGAGLAAFGVVHLDGRLDGDWPGDRKSFWAGGAEGARTMMATVAGSLITVTSIVFSLTITTLAQSSSHFGSRVLRNFTSDRGVQVTLGTFIATFIYCLVVLRTVRSVEESSFVPYLAVNLGLLLTLASLAVLIYFIHHISQAIQADNLIAEVGNDFFRMLPEWFPKRVGKPHEQSDDPPPAEEAWESAWSVELGNSGYLQRVDDEKLMSLAVKHDLLVKLEKRPGHFISMGAPVARMLPTARMDAEREEEFRGCFILGRHRTPHQDPLYPIQQLVEIGAHALSPGINEPFTAFTCIDWLGSCLRAAVKSVMPEALRRDEEGKLRAVCCPFTFDEMVEMSFGQIRVYGAHNPEVLVRLLGVIEGLGPRLHRVSDCAVLRHHAANLAVVADDLGVPADRIRVRSAHQQAMRALHAAEKRCSAA